jgi:PQQ-dependent dehydrogenase (methanol/ethanol family)
MLLPMRGAWWLAWLGLALACSQERGAPEGPRPVDDARLRAAASEPESWLSYGGGHAEQHYSALDRIDASNVSRLGLAWSFDLQTERGVQSTPLVADGTMYVTAPWSVVFALDAATGALRWRFDPEVPRSYTRSLCCGVANRGVALYGGRVYVGTLDGRLIALDVRTGQVAWETRTVDPERPYSITGAPRAVEGRIVIGNGGADLGVRGYVSAYDAQTGALAWRTYTVPGNPADGFESPALERAAATWSGEWWRSGGGGTVWDGMAYDPELRLLYVGTGNGSPYPRWVRSPGGGDNLYLASILALRPDTGELVWHYQTTPAETWDYTATQPLLLADLEIDGRARRVLLQAPKNGFFYVIDRETGAFISAAPFVPVTWASGVGADGRPVETDVDYREQAKFVKPSPLGAHNWEPMSYSPRTGLVYLPALDMGSLFKVDPHWEYRPGGYNSALDVSVFENFGSGGGDSDVRGQLVAWDPRAQRAVWRVDHVTGGNGGTLATAGDLVFQASADGRFVAYRATDGAKLWESPLGTGGGGGPVSYLAAGEQYVAVASGWGSAFAMSASDAARRAGVRGGGRVLAYKLGGNAPLPAPAQPPLGPVPAPSFALEASAEERARGSLLYHLNCSTCHGALAVGGGSGIPDLRYSSAQTHAAFAEIVLGGQRTANGMPGFADRISPDEARMIQAWILHRAAESAGKS